MRMAKEVEGPRPAPVGATDGPPRDSNCRPGGRTPEYSKRSAGTSPRNAAAQVQSRRQSGAFLPSEGSRPLLDGILPAGMPVCLAAESKAE